MHGKTERKTCEDPTDFGYVAQKMKREIAHVLSYTYEKKIFSRKRTQML